MAKAHAEWTVLEHGPIETLAENLWRVSGAVPGMSLRRTMVVARRADGTLVVHSAIALAEDAMRALESFGPVRHLIVPNGYHRLDAVAYKKRFPEARVYAPKGSRAAVEQVIAVDATYVDFPRDAAVQLAPLPGVRDREGAMIVRSKDGVTWVLTDVMMNMDKKTDFLGWLFTTVLGSAPGPRVSRLSRVALVDDQPALRAELLRFAEMPDLARVIVAHEKVASGPDAAAALRQAATFLRAR